jgi:hypothetical protein
MYTVYFLIGFVSSFGWWSAGKIQKAVDTPSVEITVKQQDKIENPIVEK